jgi:Tol biopolymer transport system component
MKQLPFLAAALAGGVALLLAACGGEGDPRPDLLLVSTRDGEYAIYALNADGGSQKRLTEAEVDPTSARRLLFQVEPDWSPDGRRIAFASKRSGTFDIYAMNADGTGTRRLTSAPADDGHPTWSPDGRRIAFERGITGDIYVMNADGSGARAITDDPAGETQPAWSPDGRWIAYVRKIPGTENREVWLVRPDGTGAHGLTELGRASHGPSWSPDSRRIAFAANIGGAVLDIYSIGVDGRSLRRHTRSADDAFEPSWSPDGKTIAFSRTGSIVLVRSPGGEVEAITEAENNDSSPTWRPRPPAED